MRLQGPVLLVLVTLFVPSIVDTADSTQVRGEEVLIGWKGETYSASDKAGSSTRGPWVETISWRPRAFIYHGFLTHEECDHLIKIAKGRLERSQVVGEHGDVEDPVRTSFSASLNLGEDEVVKSIEERIARWTHLPVLHGEAMEVLRYKDGQKYEEHWDWFEAKEIKDSTGNRVATVLMYLSDVLDGAGGETALPLALPLDDRVQTLDSMSPCAKKRGLSIRPKKGDTLLFWDLHPDGQTPDRRTLHASCPTFKGAKWTATKWLHNKAYSVD
mmetsp:Transcript_15986/g.34537  ORF Transcript_15986/g.34537 Transcript_15986/m.34537 type:complete len:272 (+) Transcript_15986:87-902(+)|eukprot:CAMPEP_0202901564 /NCGR_PEP_ID=MMETSP1392-20130828/14329_1 /ASSEMBLY_ACC=CAM_ASM_000868 /TAXON_ID=225041 /ORGANISM="Chlamydomonas chlamydogama, Strain SAG 11-48b" /LENGTH=271 /DNA_ID=CAMNT_0049588147 /DNA_START=75 /DNA_END=890 /DNA_ORIENTATION=-